jgi:hypothetical protein
MSAFGMMVRKLLDWSSKEHNGTTSGSVSMVIYFSKLEFVET